MIACKDCEFLEEGKERHCVFEGCFGRTFNPYTGEHGRTRTCDYYDWNVDGNCRHFKQKSRRPKFFGGT